MAQNNMSEKRKAIEKEEAALPEHMGKKATQKWIVNIIYKE